MFNRKGKGEGFSSPQSEVEFIAEAFEPENSATSFSTVVEDSAEPLEVPVSAPPPPPAQLTDDASLAPIVAPVYGPKTTFGSMPWWSEKNWWKVAESGEGNDVRAHVGTVGDLALAVTSVRGHKHRLGGAVNQDSYATRTVTLEDGRSFIIVVVCDGMGSAQFSSYGARLFSQNMASVLAMTISEAPDDYREILNRYQTETLRHVSKGIFAYRDDEFDAPTISKDQITIRDIQCTMTFAIVPAFAQEASDRTRYATMGFIGDSPAFLLDNEEWNRVDENKDGSGIWSSATEGAINSEKMLFQEVPMRPGSALLLTSDGVGNYMRFEEKPTSLGHDLATRWAQPVGMLEFIRDVSFETQSADDDRTAAVIWVDR
jgi:serine/threonine protein phosphatase PrpC